MLRWQHEGNMDRLGYLKRPHPIKWNYFTHPPPRYFFTAVNLHTATSILPADARFLPLPSLHCLFISSATRVLRLHHIREFRGAGKGLDVQLLKHLICRAQRQGSMSSIVTAEFNVAAHNKRLLKWIITVEQVHPGENPSKQIHARVTKDKLCSMHLKVEVHNLSHSFKARGLGLHATHFNAAEGPLCMLLNITAGKSTLKIYNESSWVSYRIKSHLNF